MTAVAGAVDASASAPMLTQVLIPFLALSAGLVVLLSGLVVGRKIARTASERSSRSRRQRYGMALLHGSKWRSPEHGDRGPARRGNPGGPGGGHVERVRHAELGALAGDRCGRARRRPGGQRDGGARIALADAPRGAALLTARLRLPGGVAALEPLLLDRDVDVRHAALGGLALLASDDAARVLVRALPAGALSADRLVERVGAPWGVPALLDALEDPHFAAVRGHLAEALGLAGDPRGREPLQELLRHGSDDERTRACRALGLLGGSDAEASDDHLLLALADPFWPVRAQAARSLGEIGDPAVAPDIERGLVDPAWWVRANCATALRRLGEPGLEALRRALHHPDRFASDRAAEALSLEAARGPSPLLPAEAVGR